MYEGDSFFTLGLAERIGLVLLSAALSLLLLLALRRLVRGRHLALRAGAALLLWWLFLWLSPQLYYLYYLALIPGLPLQSVIGWPPGPEEAGRLLIFAERHSLSAHARGALGWAFVAAALLPARPSGRAGSPG